jgi:hypothetical protein
MNLSALALKMTGKKDGPSANRRAIKNKALLDFLLSLATLVTTSCEFALHTKDPDIVERNIRHGKKAYACMLRYVGRLSLTARDVREFESRTIGMEKVISMLEQRRIFLGSQPK